MVEFGWKQVTGRELFFIIRSLSGEEGRDTFNKNVLGLGFIGLWL